MVDFLLENAFVKFEDFEGKNCTFVYRQRGEYSIWASISSADAYLAVKGKHFIGFKRVYMEIDDYEVVIENWLHRLKTDLAEYVFKDFHKIVIVSDRAFNVNIQIDDFSELADILREFGTIPIYPNFHKLSENNS